MTKYKRLRDLSRTVWSLLTEEERARYTKNTELVFIADVARILDVEVSDLLVELFDEILEQL
jgi:hypothetical protein